MNARTRHIALVLIACTFAIFATGAAGVPSGPPTGGDDDDLLGIDLGGGSHSHKPTVEAAFRLESYRPGDSTCR